MEGVELGLGHGIRVGVEPHVREQRLHDAQGAGRPLAPVREVAELPPPQRLHRTTGRLVAQPVAEGRGDVDQVVAEVAHRGFGVEHWDTAINQAKIAAHNLAGGDEVYDAMPYFFTDQYDLGMEYVGHAGADDEVVVHGDLEGLAFRAFSLRDGRVVAAMHANDWDATDDLRAAVASGELPPAP